MTNPSKKQKTAPKSTNKRTQRPPQSNRISAVTASTSQVRTQKPRISTSMYNGDARVTVRHREYIGDVSGSVAFSNTQYPINPGMVQTFPWLASIAKNYESYKFRKLNFEFETQKSTATNGSLMMGVDFDAADSAPGDKVDLMSMHNSVRSAVWAECQFRCDGQDLNKFGTQRFIRQASLSSNLDIKTYDVGTFNIATQGCADATAIGELYVNYEIDLMTPQRSNDVAISTRLAGVSGTSSSSWLGTTPTSTGGGAWTGTANTLTCVIPGDYVICTYLAAASAITSVAPTGTAASTGYAIYGNGSNALCKAYTIANAVAGQTYILNDTSGGAWSASNVVIAPFTA